MTSGSSSASGARGEPPKPGEHAPALTKILAERIRASGPISFAEFMRECLYHPVHGYYSRANAARFGDYYTSVDVHPIFGRLLARQLAEMWEVLGSPSSFVVAESGAGVGRLAGHILDFSARALHEFYTARAALNTRRASRFMWRPGAFRAPAKFHARFPRGALFQTSCWTLCPFIALLWRKAPCGKSLSH